MKTTGIEVIGVMKAHYEAILTSEALTFIEELERNFGKRRLELLQFRQNGKMKSIVKGSEMFTRNEADPIQ